MYELPATPVRPVLILGGGIHGAAVARDLILNGIPVVLVDSLDLAGGATSKSSRLIHGGLRYLEYGDVGLVAESLRERRRLLKLAPHLVRPLRLFVPTTRRWSGLLRSTLGFFKLERTRLGRRLLGRRGRRVPRGYWPIRFGLWMYDLLSWGDALPHSRGYAVRSAGPHPDCPAVDAATFRWLSAYSDAQMVYPERCVLDLLADAESAAAEQGLDFRVLPYATVRWTADHTGSVQIQAPRTGTFELEPRLVVHCSGAWGDFTLKSIEATTTPLFAGTKGSHLVTRHPELRARLNGQGIYAETSDRRLAFILPFEDAVLVGTTDERWSGPPETAVATVEELEYLLNVVRRVFGITLTADDVDLHYSGVRPLPRTLDTSNAAISRDHHVVEHRLHGMTVLTLVGGKLTTFRQVAEELTDAVLARFGQARVRETRDRVLAGGDGFPRDAVQWSSLWQAWAQESGTTVAEVALLWPLFGMRVRQILSEVAGLPCEPIADSPLTRRVVRWMIDREWVTTLDDLVERRLMLLFAARVTRATLQDLGACLVAAGRLSPETHASAVAATAERLKSHYGRTVE